MSDLPERGDDQVPWSRLHPLTALAGTLFAGAIVFGSGLVTAVALLIGGVGPGWVALWTGGGTLVVTAVIGGIEVLRVRAISYRFGSDRLELRIRFIGSSVRSLPLDRIRTIDLTADIFQRVFGLTSVRFGTGDQSGTQFTLTALGRTEAEGLRRRLIGSTAPDTGPDDGPIPGVGRLATFDPRWIRYAPVSLGTPALGLAAFGGVVQVADWFSAVPTLWTYVTGLLGPLGLALQILVLLLLALVVGVVASMIIFIESWWGYRLDRDPDGTLHIQRGLLVRRSSSYAGARVRGFIVDEPIGYRLAGAAKLRVVAVGLQTEQSSGSKQPESSTIVPPAPRPVVAGVAAVISGRPLPTDLVGHPPAAARRRYRWAVLIFLGVLALPAIPAVLVSSELRWLVGGAAVIGLPVGWWLTRDNISGLGHLITDDQVVLRSGSVFRSTVVLTRAGLLGWNLRQSPGQRRLGLVTLVATSAASPGHFRLPDVDPDQAAELQRTSGDVWDPLWVG